MILGIDAGFGNVKIAWRDLEGKKNKISTLDFPSRVKETDESDIKAIMINDGYYNFDDADLVVDNGHFSKDNADTRLLLYKALYEVYKKTGETKFDIVTNCALDSYKLDKGKSIINRMTELREIKVKETFKNEVILTINNLIVMPECLSGVGLVKKIKLKDEEVVVIDFGTLNLQGIQIIKGVPQYNTTFSTSFGMQHIYRGLYDVVKLVEPELASLHAVQMYLEKTAKGDIKPIQKVEEAVLNYLVETIFKELSIELKQIKMSMFAKLIFVGGGSIVMKRFLEAKFTDKERIFVDDAYFANAYGMQATGERAFSN